MEKPKKLKALFYRGSSGKEPVLDWLKSLSKEERKLIGDDIKTVEYGWPIGMPVCRGIGKGLYEVRTELRNTIARVLFSIAGDKMILLHGFVKKTQKTPTNELETAQRRLREGTIK